MPLDDLTHKAPTDTPIEVHTSVDEMEAFIAEHGIPGFLDYLGLDGAANKVNTLIRIAQAADELDTALMFGRPPAHNDYTKAWLALRNALAQTEGIIA